jgi:alpha-ketoglutarate-dependent taurine dioxygenase
MDILPLSSPLGAEVKNVSLRNPLAANVVESLENALAHYGVLVFHQQYLTENEQMEFSKHFGDNKNSNILREESPIDEPTDKVVHRGKQDYVEYWTDGPTFGNLSFVEGHPFWPLSNFHTDLSYVEKPLQYTILAAIETPQVGGETEFVDTKKAYDTLAPEIKHKLYNRNALHSAPRMGFTELVPHPIIASIPVNNQNVLYVNKLFTKAIEGEEENQELLLSLLDHIDNCPARFKFKWQDGDVIVWDNLRVVHRRCPYPKDQPRVLRRTQGKRIEILAGSDNVRNTGRTKASDALQNA